MNEKENDLFIQKNLEMEEFEVLEERVKSLGDNGNVNRWEMKG